MATVTSDSNPDHLYELRLGLDGRVYCTCPSWKFHGHCCKHMMKAAVGVFNAPHLVNAPSLEAVQEATKAQIQAQSAGYFNAEEMRAAKAASKVAAVPAANAKVA
jgi:hypothetical protein